jgi:ribosome biogenesis GTPase / thiamine phosphate phosphatase
MGSHSSARRSCIPPLDLSNIPFEPIQMTLPMHGTIVSLTRRYAQVDCGEGTIVQGITARDQELVVGDQVRMRPDPDPQGHPLIDERVPRRNHLFRSYLGKTKSIAANVDHLFVVSAVDPLFNTIFIDRLIVACHVEGIACSLIINKVDLGIATTEELARPYSEIGIPLLWVSAKVRMGIEGLMEQLWNTSLNLVVFSGISGVGKSSLLNVLIPEASRTTGEVSAKTGKGKQTTSQSFAYRLKREAQPCLYVVDSPGVQHFGLTHLTKRQVAEGFAEFGRYVPECEFRDCAHLEERRCAVKDAVERGYIATSRYSSYLHILEEIASAREY